MSGIVGGVGSKSGVIGTTELDYEEGNITNSLIVGGTPFTSYGSFTNNYAVYRRIGNMVFCSYFLHSNSVNLGTGTATLAIPFTSSVSNYSFGVFSLYKGGTWYRNGRGRTIASAAEIELYQDVDVSTVLATATTTLIKIYGSITYYI